MTSDERIVEYPSIFYGQTIPSVTSDSFYNFAAKILPLHDYVMVCVIIERNINESIRIPCAMKVYLPIHTKFKDIGNENRCLFDT